MYWGRSANVHPLRPKRNDRGRRGEHTIASHGDVLRAARRHGQSGVYARPSPCPNGRRVESARCGGVRDESARRGGAQRRRFTIHALLIPLGPGQPVGCESTKSSGVDGPCGL